MSAIEGLLSSSADADKLAASKAQLEGRLKATDAKVGLYCHPRLKCRQSSACVASEAGHVVAGIHVVLSHSMILGCNSAPVLPGAAASISL